MNIDINVLPDGQKEKIKEEKKIGFASKMAIAFIAVLLLVNAVLYLMNMILKIEYRAVKRSSELGSQNTLGKENKLEEIFKDTNSRVAAISKINSSIPHWAKVMIRISDICPSGIRLDQMNADGSQLKIVGFSKSREDLLDFQNKLKAEGFQFPVDISNLVASKDFSFDLDITIPTDYLSPK